MEEETSIFIDAGVIAFSCKHGILWDSRVGTPCTTWVYIYALSGKYSVDQGAGILVQVLSRPQPAV